MMRQVAAVALMLVLNPSGLIAQTPAAPATVPAAELKINNQAATVYRSPSTGSPVVGTAQRGTVLPVTRELGSWVRVSWPQGEDGTGYVHVSAGSLTVHVAPADKPVGMPNKPRTGRSSLP